MDDAERDSLVSCFQFTRKGLKYHSRWLFSTWCRRSLCQVLHRVHSSWSFCFADPEPEVSERGTEEADLWHSSREAPLEEVSSCFLFVLVVIVRDSRWESEREERRSWGLDLDVECLLLSGSAREWRRSREGLDRNVEGLLLSWSEREGRRSRGGLDRDIEGLGDYWSSRACLLVKILLHDEERAKRPSPSTIPFQGSPRRILNLIFENPARSALVRRILNRGNNQLIHWTTGGSSAWPVGMRSFTWLPSRLIGSLRGASRGIYPMSLMRLWSIFLVDDRWHMLLWTSFLDIRRGFRLRLWFSFRLWVCQFFTQIGWSSAPLRSLRLLGDSGFDLSHFLLKLEKANHFSFFFFADLRGWPYILGSTGQTGNAEDPGLSSALSMKTFAQQKFRTWCLNSQQPNGVELRAPPWWCLELLPSLHLLSWHQTVLVDIKWEIWPRWLEVGDQSLMELASQLIPYP